MLFRSPRPAGLGSQSAGLRAQEPLAEFWERQPPGPDLGEGNVSEKGQVLENGGRVGVLPSRARLGDQVRPEASDGIGRDGPRPAPPGPAPPRPAPPGSPFKAGPPPLPLQSWAVRERQEVGDSRLQGQ